MAQPRAHVKLTITWPPKLHSHLPIWTGPSEPSGAVVTFPGSVSMGTAAGSHQATIQLQTLPGGSNGRGPASSFLQGSGRMCFLEAVGLQTLLRAACQLEPAVGSPPAPCQVSCIYAVAHFIIQPAPDHISEFYVFFPLPVCRFWPNPFFLSLSSECPALRQPRCSPFQ